MIEWLALFPEKLELIRARSRGWSDQTANDWHWFELSPFIFCHGIDVFHKSFSYASSITSWNAKLWGRRCFWLFKCSICFHFFFSHHQQQSVNWAFANFINIVYVKCWWKPKMQDLTYTKIRISEKYINAYFQPFWIVNLGICSSKHIIMNFHFDVNFIATINAFFQTVEHSQEISLHSFLTSLTVSASVFVAEIVLFFLMKNKIVQM